MPNPGDFDPAEAVQDARQQLAAEKAEKERIQEQQERAKAQQQAQQELERANVLELFLYAEKELEVIRNPIVSEFVVTERWSTDSWWRDRPKRHQRQTRYYGSWLSLNNQSGYHTTKSGLVKLRQPRAGYASVLIHGDWDPRNVSYVTLDVIDVRGHQKIPNPSLLGGDFRIFASLEETTEGKSAEGLTWCVTRALDFVATGRPPDPAPSKWPDHDFT